MTARLGLVSAIPFPLNNKTDFCDWLNAETTQSLPIVEFVSRAHYEFAAIHPFTDGNGRTARLLMNLLLLRRGYPIAIIRMRDRDTYLDALATAASEGLRLLQDLISKLGGKPRVVVGAPTQRRDDSQVD